MKKSLVIFMIGGLVLITTGIWYFNADQITQPTEFFHFGIIILIVAFAFFIGIKRMGSSMRGEPAEDELSKKVMIRTAAYSFYISLYLWVFLIFIKDRITFEVEQLLGTGVLGMAVIFALTWIVLNFKGIRDE